jgi:DhnA family fructose-bisphosphate aldolase class Ia
MTNANVDGESLFPSSLLDEITELRVNRPEAIEEEARRRLKRPQIAPDGKLVLAAVDHPARGVTEIRGDKLAMGDRWQFLARVRRVLQDPNLDGVVASSDILDELFLLSCLERRRTERSFLDGRVIVGSMNRGGLAGAIFEMEDTFTSLTAARLAELRCDGGKMLCRLDPQDPASGRTLTSCALAVTELRRQNLAAFVEPLGVQRKEGGGYDTLKDAASMVRQAGIAAALGESSAHVWLKIPYSQDLARVCRATTLPILLLGGPARETAEETLRDFADGLAAGKRVRGAIIGRNLLYPGDADPLPMCRALTSMVHEGASFAEAIRMLKSGEAVGAAQP